MQRRSDIDWMRVLAVLLVFITHSAQVFSPIDDWHIADPEPSQALGLFTVGMATWIMPLFIFLAGQSAWFALRRRNFDRFLRERVFKLLIPLIVGSVLVVPPQLYLRRVSRGEFEGSYLAFYPHFFTEGFFPEGNLSYGHLWFLAYLFAYALAALPVFGIMQRPRARYYLRRLAAALSHRGSILWLFVPLAAGQLLLRPYFPQTTGALVGDWATHAWFFPVYLAGFAVMLEPRFERALARDWRIAAPLALITTAALMVWALPGDVYARIPSEPSLNFVVFWVGFTLSSWAWIVFLSGAAHHWLSHSSPFLRYWGDRVYPFYVFHQTVIVVVAFYIVQWSVGVWLKFPALLGIAFAGTLLVLQVVGTIPGIRGIFGVRKAPREPGPVDPAPAHQA